MKFAILSILTFTAVTASCPSGWQLFNRIQSDWCIKVFPGTLTRQSAQEYCRKQGAVLTGIETAAERNYITSQTLVFVNAGGAINGSLWIGARRRNECLGRYRIDAQCLPSGNNAMEWTDNHTTGTDGFYWRPTEPDYFLNAQPWVFMHVFDTNTALVTGMMSDVGAEMTFCPEAVHQTIWAYACGKEAN